MWNNDPPRESCFRVARWSSRCFAGRFQLGCFPNIQRNIQRDRFATWNWQLTLSPAYNRISRNA